MNREHPLPSVGVRNPDTIFLLGFLTTSGLAQLVAGTEPGSVASLVQPWIVSLWASLLTLGALVTLAGALVSKRTTGLMLEATGRVMLAPACAAYAVAIAASNLAQGGFVIGILLGLTAASIWRLWQIHRTMQALWVFMESLERKAE